MAGFAGWQLAALRADGGGLGVAISEAAIRHLPSAIRHHPPRMISFNISSCSRYTAYTPTR